MRMSKVWLVVCLAALMAGGSLGLCGQALAGGDNYMAGRFLYGFSSDVERDWGGTNTSTSKYENALGAGLAYGLRLGWARLEGEVSYNYLKIKGVTNSAGVDLQDASGSDKLLTFAFNTYADLVNQTAFTPFVGVGIGACYVTHNVELTTPTSGKNIKVDDGTWVLAYQLMAGVNWALNQDFSVELMYRYFGLAERSHDVSGGNATSLDLDPHQIHLVVLGLRWWF